MRRTEVRQSTAGSTTAARADGTPGHHLAPLADGWGLWRWCCLRAAGFPFELLEPLADVRLAELADRANAGGTDADYLAHFPTAVRDLGRALRRAAADPRIREAVAWQNPHALTTGFDTLLHRDPDGPRPARHRRTESLVTNYLHRYCAKNDTIGFFGPLRWGRIDTEQADAIRVEHDGAGGSRTLYLEGWAVTVLGRVLAPTLRPWLAPRRRPLLGFDGECLWAPTLTDPLRLDAVSAALLRACHPKRTAIEVVAMAGVDPAAGWAALERLADNGWIEWTLEAPADDLRAVETVRAVVAKIDDQLVRQPALDALDRLTGLLDTVAAARGDAEQVVTALDALGGAFTELTGAAATRAEGKLYAGRTLVFEECRAPESVVLGPTALDPLRAPLALLLESARWFNAAGAALYQRALREIFTRLAADRSGVGVPFAELWLAGHDLLIGPAEQVVRPLTRAFQQRWSRLLDLPAGERRVRREVDELRPGLAAAFPPGPAGWAGAIQHSPDLMMAAADLAAINRGEVEWVLGELHPGYHTMRYATWLDAHPHPAELTESMIADLPGGVFRAGASAAQGGSSTRFSPLMSGPADRRLVYAPDTSDYDPDRDLLAGDCTVYDEGGRLVVRQHDDPTPYDLIDVLGELIAARLMPHFRLLPPAGHRPRVMIGPLVVARESWTMPTGEVDFVADADEARRFRRARAWATGHDLPRHVFIRTTGEAKPVHIDLAGLASVEVLCRAVRRAHRTSGAAARLTVTEMLPTPQQLWLSDEQGRRYSAELRFVAAPYDAGRSG